VAAISRLLKIIGLFCRIWSLLQGSFAKEIYHFKEPTNRSHPIAARLTVQNDCRTDFCKCVPVSEDVAREQARARSSETKLTEAMSELKRMRESNSKYDASAKEYKAQSIGALGTHVVM